MPLFLHSLSIELWCNGSTTDFGSVCLGSNPSSSTKALQTNCARLLYFGKLEVKHSLITPGMKSFTVKVHLCKRKDYNDNCYNNYDSCIQFICLTSASSSIQKLNTKYSRPEWFPSIFSKFLHIQPHACAKTITSGWNSIKSTTVKAAVVNTLSLSSLFVLTSSRIVCAFSSQSPNSRNLCCLNTL